MSEYEWNFENSRDTSHEFYGLTTSKNSTTRRDFRDIATKSTTTKSTLFRERHSFQGMDDAVALGRRPNFYLIFLFLFLFLELLVQYFW